MHPEAIVRDGTEHAWSVMLMSAMYLSTRLVLSSEIFVKNRIGRI